MTSNNDNTLLDLAANVRMLYHQTREEGRVNGREDYYQGRCDAYRTMSDDIREKLELDETEYNHRINGRLALRLLGYFLDLTEDGRYVVTCKEGRVTSVTTEEIYLSFHKA